MWYGLWIMDSMEYGLCIIHIPESIIRKESNDVLLRIRDMLKQTYVFLNVFLRNPFDFLKKIIEFLRNPMISF